MKNNTNYIYKFNSINNCKNKNYNLPNIFSINSDNKIINIFLYIKIKIEYIYFHQSERLLLIILIHVELIIHHL